METILKICNALKGFGDYITANNTLRGGYIDIFVLLGIAALTTLALTFIERSNA